MNQSLQLGAYKLTLPFPRSLSGYWEYVATGKKSMAILSDKGVRYRKQILASVYDNGCHRLKLKEKISVTISVSPHDKSEIVISDVIREILDALNNAGVWLDNNQIDDLRIKRCKIEEGGRLVVNITEIEG